MGDMFKSVYDPNVIEADAFAMDNMAEGADAKIMTAAERARIAALQLTSTNDLRNVDTTLVSRAYVSQDGRGGSFDWVGNDLSSLLAHVGGTTTSVNSATDTCTLAGHNLWTARAFILNTSVNGLTANTIYYSIRVDDNNFKVATSFENAHDGIAVNLTGTTNFSYRRLLDPLQGVYVIPNGFPIDGSQGAWVRMRSNQDVSAHWFGFEAKNNAAKNDAAALQAAFYFAGFAFNLGAGAKVSMDTGIAYLGETIYAPNRVSFSGQSGRGSILRPHSSFTQQRMFHNINTNLLGNETSTSSTFAVRWTDCYIDARGYNMQEVFYAEAWQETSGMERVLLQYDGTTRYGLHLVNGWGGASYVLLRDVEVFANSTNVLAAGIKISEVSAIGGFMLNLTGCSIVGSPANLLPNCILFDKDSSVISTLHVEHCVNAITVYGPGSHSIDTVTGSSWPVTNILTVGSNFTGKIHARNLIPNGATGNTVNNLPAGENIPASEGMLIEYVWPKSGFLARMATDKTNLTGNGATAVVNFDTEVFDRRAEYNPATGTFTALRSGKYDFSAYVKLGLLSVGTTNCVITLATSNRNYVLFRGDPEAFRDSSGNVTLGGAVTSVDMDRSDIARVTVIVTGLAGNTVGALSGESYFSGSWIER